MKRKPLRPIDIVNHAVHREASTGGVPECFTRKAVADAPFTKYPVKQLTKALRRKP